MDRYRCHKVVEAAKVITCLHNRRAERPRVTVYLQDGSNIEVDGKVFARGYPKEGDYLVRYEDGHLSWSPKDVFEAGYTRIVEDEAA